MRGELIANDIVEMVKEAESKIPAEQTFPEPFQSTFKFHFTSISTEWLTWRAAWNYDDPAEAQQINLN